MVSEVTIPKNSKQTLLLVEKVTVQKLVIDSYFYSLKLVSTIVGRGFLTPLFYGDPVPAPPPFSSFVQPPPPSFPFASNPHLRCCFFCLVYLA